MLIKHIRMRLTDGKNFVYITNISKATGEVRRLLMCLLLFDNVEVNTPNRSELGWFVINNFLIFHSRILFF